MLFWSLTIFQIILLIGGFVIVLRLFYIITTFRNFAEEVPYVPTPRSVIKKMIEAADIRQSQQQNLNIIDLGSGTGKILFCLAKHLALPSKLYGIEKSRLLYIISCLRRLINPHRKRIKIILGNWHDIDLKNFGYLFLFLTRPGLKALLPKFKRELKPSAKIITYLFPLPKNRIFKEQKMEWGKGEKIFLYQKATRRTV